jgi:hypothetical protein
MAAVTENVICFSAGFGNETAGVAPRVHSAGAASPSSV